MNTKESRVKIRIKCKLHLKIGRHGQKKIIEGPAPKSAEVHGTVPRISRLMALAIHFDSQIQQGHARDYKNIAELVHVTPPRMTQIMSLINLAPDIQENLLFLPNTKFGRDIVTERSMRNIVAVVAWEEQRKMWIKMNAGL